MFNPFSFDDENENFHNAIRQKSIGETYNREEVKKAFNSLMLKHATHFLIGAGLSAAIHLVLKKKFDY